MTTLTILYDAECELCRRCRDWMERQSTYVRVDWLSCASPEARATFGVIPWLGTELIVVADDGRVWAGAAAFLVCLWALREWREWSYRLATPALAPFAERFFRALSAERRRVGALFSHSPCADGTCRIPAYSAARGPYR
jgi:predicted DCC family thiol-disulfide oxidoreductase YuxK